MCSTRGRAFFTKYQNYHRFVIDVTDENRLFGHYNCNLRCLVPYGSHPFICLLIKFLVHRTSMGESVLGVWPTKTRRSCLLTFKH